MFHLAIYNQHSPWQFPRGFSWGGSTNIPGEGHDVNLRSVWCSFFHSGRLKSVYFILKLESIFVDNMKSFNKIKWQLHWQKDKDKLSDQNSKAKLKTNLVDGETAVATVPLSTLKGGAFDNLVPVWWSKLLETFNLDSLLLGLSGGSIQPGFGIPCCKTHPWYYNQSKYCET